MLFRFDDYRLKVWVYSDENVRFLSNPAYGEVLEEKRFKNLDGDSNSRGAIGDRSRRRSQDYSGGHRDSRYSASKASQTTIPIRRKMAAIRGVEGDTHIVLWKKIQRCRPLVEHIDEQVSSALTRITLKMNYQLALPFKTMEVKQATFGSDVTKSLVRILNDQILLHKLNYTHIVLIPKVNSLEVVFELCPVSLGNIVVKIASKFIANGLKSIMDAIVSPSQSAFIPGRLITNNVLLAFEVNHFLKISSWAKKGFVVLKLDMSKAYDRIQWSIFRHVLLRLGFESDIVNLIMLLVTSISYSLTLNAPQFGYFRPEQRICQEDPLSPYHLSSV
ncbi:UNVERIFIED_CONTAM: hypothetical protein Scaly_1933900 [Sesamum calycinum]|uniref:Reverse transcriptase domain-containing protein n=1 Tax=Sesamum calycinum TaxID=2727403 RepID=A0AAW2NIA2_9LAMI